MTKRVTNTQGSGTPGKGRPAGKPEAPATVKQPAPPEVPGVPADVVDEDEDEDPDGETDEEAEEQGSALSSCGGIRFGDPPSAPVNLRVAANGQTKMTVGWIDTANNEDGFEVERGLDGVSFNRVGTTAPNVVVFNDSGLSPDTTYYYRALAFNNNGKSAYSNVDSDTTEEGSTGGIGKDWDDDDDHEDPFGDRHPPPPPPGGYYDPCPLGSKCISSLFKNLTVEYVDADDGTVGVMERFYDSRTQFEVVYNCDMNEDVDGNPVSRAYNGVTIPAHTGHIFKDDLTKPSDISMIPPWAELEAFFHPGNPNGTTQKIPFSKLEDYCAEQPKEPRGSSADGRQYFVYPPFRHLYYWKKGSDNVTQAMADEAFTFIHDWVKVEIENRPWAHISKASTPPTVHSDYSLNQGTFRHWTKSKDSDDGWGAWEESGMEHLPSANFAALGSRLGVVALWQTWKWVVQAIRPGIDRGNWHKQTRSMAYMTKLCMSAYWAGFDLADPDMITLHVGGLTPRFIMGQIVNELNSPVENSGLRRLFEGPTSSGDWKNSSRPSLDYSTSARGVSHCGECAVDDWEDSTGKKYGRQLEQKVSGQGGDIMFAMGQVWWHHKWSVIERRSDDLLLSVADLGVTNTIKRYLEKFMKKAGWFWDDPQRGQFSRWCGRVDVEETAVTHFPTESVCWEAIDWSDATCVSGVSQGCDYNAGRTKYRARRVPVDLDDGTGTVGWNSHRFEGFDAWRFPYSAMAVMVYPEAGDPWGVDLTVRESEDYWDKWGLKGDITSNNWLKFGDQFIVPIYAMLEFYKEAYELPGDGPPPPVAPNPPSNLVATGFTKSKIKLTWLHDQLEMDLNDEFDFYEIQGRLSSGTDADYVTLKNVKKITRRLWRNKELASDTTYTYRIRAVNNAGPSDWSNVATGTTLDGGPDDTFRDWKDDYKTIGDNYKQCPTGSGCISPLWPDLKYEYADADDGTAGVMERFYDTKRDFEVVFNADIVERSWAGRVICPHRGYVFKDDQVGDADGFEPPKEYYEYEDFWFPGPDYPFVDGDWRNNKADVSPGGDSRRLQVYPPFRFVSEYRKGNPNVTKAVADRWARDIDVWMRVEVELRPWSHISAPFTPPTVKGTKLNDGTPREWSNETKTDGSCGTRGWNCWDYGHNETGAQSAYAGLGHRLGAVMLWMNWRWLIRAISPGREQDGWRSQPRSMHHTTILIERAYWAGFDYADPDLIDAHCGGQRPISSMPLALDEINNPKTQQGIRNKFESFKTPSGNVTINFNAECGACDTNDFEDSLGRKWGHQMQAQFWWQGSFMAGGLGRLWHADQLSTANREGDELLGDKSVFDGRVLLDGLIDYMDMVSKKYAFWWDGPTTLNGATADRGRYPYTFGRFGDTVPAGGVFPDRIVTDDMISFIWRDCDVPPGTKGCKEKDQDTRGQYLSHRIPTNHDDPTDDTAEGWNLYKGNTSDNRWFFPYTAGIWMRPPDFGDPASLGFSYFENGTHYIEKHGYKNTRSNDWFDYQHHTMYYYTVLDLYEIPYTLP